MPRSLAQEPQPHGKVLLQHLHLCDSLCVEAVGTKPIKVSLDTVKNPHVYSQSKTCQVVIQNLIMQLF